LTGSQVAGDVAKNLINTGSNALTSSGTSETVETTSGSGFNLGKTLHSVACQSAGHLDYNATGKWVGSDTYKKIKMRG